MREALVAEVKKILENRYSYCKDEDGWFKFELYVDYRDEMDSKTAIEILESKEPMVAFDEKMDEWYFDAEIAEENERLEEIKKELTSENGLYPDGLDEEAEDMLRDVFSSVAYIALPYDHFLDQEFRVNIMVDTGDGNYDYTLNSVYPAYCGRYGDTIDDNASIVWLAKKQGYTKTELKNALKEGDMSNPTGFLQTMRVELANAASHMNTLTFLAKMTLRELIVLNKMIALQDRNGIKYDAKKRPYCGYIVISKEAETGLYDPWNGGGSVFEVQLEKDFRLPVRYIRSALPDGGDGWSIDSVYGMCHSCWRDVVKEMHGPKNVETEVA